MLQAGDSPGQNGPPKSFYSRIDESTNEMLLLVYRPLDYEVTPSYTLTIKAAVRLGTFSFFDILKISKDYANLI